MHIDWAALHSAFQMNMPEVRCFLRRSDGTVVKLAPSDPSVAELRSDRDRFVPIEAVPSRLQYQWLDEFVRTVDDPETRARMEAAINGKGAFRRFKDILLTLPDERRRWFEFRDQAMRMHVVEWVRELGLDAENEPPWTASPSSTGTTERPNATSDVEALRDLLIAWVGERGPDTLSPLALEALADEISARFLLRQRETD